MPGNKVFGPMKHGSAAVEVLVPALDEERGGPIDRVHLAKQCLGDANLEIEILRMFDLTIQTYMDRLRQAEDPEEIAKVLHTLKGAAAGVGAVAIATLARQGEQEMQAGRNVESEAIADIGMAVEEVRAYITQQVGLDDE
ncbi:Hpt domain-containing protein [Devosia rhodophyticola]|uniref:Hpt domain-containing protein n=1 Tax=Devosia rhodophyticola TaxID=3026423 RepID=A0ABY7YVJ9_9HYPH|nr:Hpt domain-containing protein [Devosia rhodophyticola]WDR05391.1 Hpt domain-containing protein [Devosia rhodophyticola]